MADATEPKPSITTGTVATAGTLGIIGMIVANLDQITPFIDKIGLAASIAIGCLVFGGVVIILVLQWISTHGAETAKSIRNNSEKQTMILSEMRTTQTEMRTTQNEHGDKIHDIHRAIEWVAKGQKTT